MKGKVRIIIFICSLILLVGSLGVIGHHYWVSHQEQKDFESLEVNGGHNVTALHKKNGDIVGWLKIGGTRIDYPVMQTPDENEYYLRRNFRKESSIAGTPFMDAGSVIGTSKNYLIFGHNIKSGTMFHDLLKYEDKAFWKKHKTFSFDMLDGHHKYKVIAAFYSQIYPVKSSQFKYYKQMSITLTRVVSTSRCKPGRLRPALLQNGGAASLHFLRARSGNDGRVSVSQSKSIMRCRNAGSCGAGFWVRCASTVCRADRDRYQTSGM